MVTFGLAPVLGANFNIGSHVTLSLTAGYRGMVYAGELEYNFFPYDRGDLTGDGGVAFVNFSVMFRTGSDSYE